MSQRVEGEKSSSSQVIIAHKPCAFNPNGATEETCQRLTAVVVRNQGGCCRINCTSPLRLCIVCVRTGETAPQVVPKGNHQTGLCVFHTQHGASAKLNGWKSLRDEQIAEEGYSAEEPDDSDDEEEQVPPQKVVVHAQQEEALAPKPVQKPAPSVASAPAPPKPPPIPAPEEPVPVTLPVQKAEEPLPSQTTADQAAPQPVLFEGLAPDVRAFFSRILPENERLPDSAAVELAQYAPEEQLRRALGMLGVTGQEQKKAPRKHEEKHEPEEPLVQAETPKVAESLAEAPRAEATPDPLAKLKSQLCAAVKTMLEAGKLTPAQARKLAPYADEIQKRYARALIAGTMKLTDIK